MRAAGELIRRPSMWAIAALVLLAVQPAASLSQSADQNEPLSIRITSPLGRTGVAGVVRIVAQVHAPPGAALNPVRIFVDNVLLGEVADGPPWAVEWTDENPFTPREIAAEVSDALGHKARDVVLLKPFEVVEKAEVSSVILETSVQDRFGRFVTGIPPAGFTVLEDSVPQTLDLLRSESLPATYTLLVDRSQSMGRRIEFVRDAAAALTGYLRPQDRIIVAPFSKTIGPVTGPTDDRQTVSDAIRGIRASGGTAILDCLEAASRLITGVEGRHAIVLITDGYDEHSSRPFEQVLATVQKSGASVYVVGIGGVAGISIRGERLLKRLAAETGGKAFFPAREIELRPVHEQVASDVQLRYLLSYTPKNQKVDGTWRQVTVTTTDPTWVVRTRPGYFAPRPPPVRPAIEFTMVDANRRLLNVSADTLRVIEDGVEQPVDVFQEAVTPVSVVFALDMSGSMRRVADDVKSAARSFVESLRPQDPLGLVLFSDRALFAHDISTTRKWSLDAIDKYEAVGGTALYDALYVALMRLRGVEGRRVVVVMTDGRDENNKGDGPGSVHRLDDVLDRLKSVDATVFTIGLGTNIDRGLLERLAADSGGESAFPLDVTTLPQEFRRVIENLRKRYVISYTSTNSSRDGRWRKVQILSTTPGVTSVSRGGYFAPPQ